MGEIRDFEFEKLVIGVLISRLEMYDRLLALLKENFGESDFISDTYSFDFTDYYTPEMGKDIKRFFISFRDFVDPGKLSEIKRLTNSIEEGFIIDGGRKINLDPGILSMNRFILATTKDNGHRIPLNDGIYGEITLIYESGEFKALPWTYADFRTEQYRILMKEIREIYKSDLKRKRSG